MATINTWKCDGAYRTRLDLLKKGLAACKPDLIACQEVFQSEAGGADTGRALADALEMHYHWVPARHKDRYLDGKQVSSYSGLALLSVYPILEAWSYILPADERDGERLAQFVRVDCHSVLVLVINTHLTHLSDASGLRKQQLASLLAQVPPTAQFGAVFLCGDFNATEDTEELRFLLRHDRFTVCNGYTAGQGTLPGYTRVPAPGAAESAQVGKAIDFIFSLTEKHHPQPVLSNGRLILDVPDEQGYYPSDHFGVMVKAQISPTYAAF